MAADVDQADRLDVLVGNPDLDAAGAAEVRHVIVDTGVLDCVKQMIRVRAAAAPAALAAALIPESTREAMSTLALATVNRQW